MMWGVNLNVGTVNGTSKGSGSYYFVWSVHGPMNADTFWDLGWCAGRARTGSTRRQERACGSIRSRCRRGRRARGTTLPPLAVPASMWLMHSTERVFW